MSRSDAFLEAWRRMYEGGSAPVGAVPVVRLTPAELVEMYPEPAEPCEHAYAVLRDGKCVFCGEMDPEL